MGRAAVADGSGVTSEVNYVRNAPKQVVDQSKAQLGEAKDLMAALDKEIQRFSAT